MRSRQWGRSVAVVTIGLVLAGCGSEPDGDTGESGETPTVTETQPTDSESQEATEETPTEDATESEQPTEEDSVSESEPTDDESVEESESEG